MFFTLPTISSTMTINEIVAAWKPVIDQLFDAVIDSAFGDEEIAAYDGALAMFAQDYTLACDYVAPVVADTDELPF